MKVLLVIDSGKAYGKERANLQVARILKENNVDIKLAVNRIADESITNEIGIFDSVKVPFPRNLKGKMRIWKFINNYFHTLVLFKRLVQKEHPDYILIPTEIAFAYLYFALRYTTAKIVFRCGDSLLIYRKRGLIAYVYGILWKNLILNRIDVIVCNARFLQRQIISSGRKQNQRDTVIYNYPPYREKILDSVVYNQGHCILRLGFIGRIVPDKGVRELIEAVLKVNNGHEAVATYICGDTSVDKKYSESLFKIADKSIKFVGEINDLEKFYANVDIVVVPSIYAEPMANVVTEAKYHKTAVIIFNQGGMPEIVEHKRTGYICPKVSVDSLAEGIEYYLKNKDCIKEHGMNAYRSIEELKLTKEEYTTKWLQVFSE